MLTSSMCSWSETTRNIKLISYNHSYILRTKSKNWVFTEKSLLIFWFGTQSAWAECVPDHLRIHCSQRDRRRLDTADGNLMRYQLLTTTQCFEYKKWPRCLWKQHNSTLLDVACFSTRFKYAHLFVERRIKFKTDLRSTCVLIDWVP